MNVKDGISATAAAAAAAAMDEAGQGKDAAAKNPVEEVPGAFRSLKGIDFVWAAVSKRRVASCLGPIFTPFVWPYD
jgi:hypothetical protein